MNVTLWDTSSDVRKELSIQDDRTESDNRIEVMLLIGIAENNLPHIARWESTKPPYAEPHVRWCGRSVNVKIGGKCLLWLAFTSYPILLLYSKAFLCCQAQKTYVFRYFAIIFHEKSAVKIWNALTLSISCRSFKKGIKLAFGLWFKWIWKAFHALS